jgi:hypothetical protein
MTDYPNQRAGRVEDPSSESWNVHAPGRTRTTTAWVGWIWFAGIMLIMLGAFGAIEGLVALFRQNYYVYSPDQILVLDLTGWGWLHLIAGVLAVVTGVALLSGQTWAGPVAVVLVALDALANLAFIGVTPLWSAIAITLCVLVIWAIVVHGDESRLDL